jgi:hypothetical protein
MATAVVFAVLFTATMLIIWAALRTPPHVRAPLEFDIKR